jgi:hypothetical protein
MSTGRALDLVILVVLLAVAVTLVPRAVAVWRVYGGIRGRRLADGSSLAPPAPAAVAALATRLAPLGFRRIGERTLVLPGAGRRFEWNLVDAATTTYVALVPFGPAARLVCYSAFADGAFVQTAFPVGTRIHRDDLVAEAVAEDPETAVATHRRLVAAAGAAHGAPLENRTMGDLLARDDTYRRRHGGATMRRRVWLFIAFTALVVVAAAGALVRLVTDA